MPKPKPRQKERTKDKAREKPPADELDSTVTSEPSKPIRSPRSSSDRITKAPRLDDSDSQGDVPMADNRKATPGPINLFGLHVGARSQPSLPITTLPRQPSLASPSEAQGTTNHRAQQQSYLPPQSEVPAPIQFRHSAPSAHNYNSSGSMPPPPVPSVQPGTPIVNRIPQPPAASPSRTSTHLDMSEDDLRSWAAAAAALLPTLTSVDQNLSNSSLDDKVSGRGY